MNNFFKLFVGAEKCTDTNCYILVNKAPCIFEIMHCACFLFIATGAGATLTQPITSEYSTLIYSKSTNT